MWERERQRREQWAVNRGVVEGRGGGLPVRVLSGSAVKIAYLLFAAQRFGSRSATCTFHFLAADKRKRPKKESLCRPLPPFYLLPHLLLLLLILPLHTFPSPYLDRLWKSQRLTALNFYYTIIIIMIFALSTFSLPLSLSLSLLRLLIYCLMWNQVKTVAFFLFFHLPRPQICIHTRFLALSARSKVVQFTFGSREITER